MGRTWLVRGVAAAVFAVLVGAWGVGVAGLRDSGSPSGDRPPPSPDSSMVPANEHSSVREKVKATPPRGRRTAPPRDPATAPSRDTDGDVRPADVAPTTPAPTSPGRTPDSTADPEKEPSDPPPPPGPSQQPDEPSDDCTDLVTVIGCVLEPFTSDP